MNIAQALAAAAAALVTGLSMNDAAQPIAAAAHEAFDRVNSHAAELTDLVRLTRCDEQLTFHVSLN